MSHIVTQCLQHDLVDALIAFCQECQEQEVPFHCFQCFLQDMVDTGKSFSISKMYSAAVSACHIGFGGKAVGQHPLVCPFIPPHFPQMSVSGYICLYPVHALHIYMGRTESCRKMDHVGLFGKLSWLAASSGTTCTFYQGLSTLWALFRGIFIQEIWASASCLVVQAWFYGSTFANLCHSKLGLPTHLHQVLQSWFYGSCIYPGFSISKRETWQKCYEREFLVNCV